MADWVVAGEVAPGFTLQDDRGNEVDLASFRGKTVVLYFYPRDDTPGCTKEACSFRDYNAEIRELGVVVMGVSPDSVESHQKFREKYNLNFPLLSDPDHVVAEAYGAWREKVRYGKKSMGIVRSTFIIGPDGKVVKVWKNVRVEGHAEKVLKTLKELLASS